MAAWLHKTDDPVRFEPSVSETAIPDPVNWFKNPDVSAVYDMAAKQPTVPFEYWTRPLADPVTEMSQAQKNAVDAAKAQAIIDDAKLTAKDIYDQLEAISRLLRAIVVLTVDEINTLRTQWRDFQSETAAAGNLGDFQARIATLPSLADRTQAQAKTKIQTEIDNEV